MEDNHSDHHHHHGHFIQNVNKAFIIGIVFNALFVIIEFVVGYYQSSLALISDAGHNLSDVVGLGFSLFAFKMMKVEATDNYTYGFKKFSILASLLNALLLIVTTIAIFYEGIQRIGHQDEIQGTVISMVALIGIFINVSSALLFLKEKEKDINLKGAYLHLLGDALVAFGVVVTGVIIYYTHWYWLDTVISFLIGIIILIATWQLLNDSIRLALDGTPRNISLEKVKQTILKSPEVAGVHHIHIWAISSNENAMTAHLVLKENDMLKFESVKHRIKHQLEHINIHHSTFELELTDCEEGC